MNLGKEESMTEKLKTWSTSLQDATRQVIGEFEFVSDPVCLKCIDGRFATLSAADLLARNLSVVDRETGQKTAFVDVEELIRAGWAVD